MNPKRHIFAEPEYPKFVNRMKKLFWGVLLALSIGCTADESRLLSGSWELYREYGMRDGRFSDWNYNDGFFRVDFERNGFGDEWIEDFDIPFVWKFVDNRLIMVTERYREISVYRIVRLTSEELRLKEIRDDGWNMECYRRKWR